jgi:hypothetical protein
VLVHVDAGTAHGELTGSRDTYVHFVQDPFDIASIVAKRTPPEIVKKLEGELMRIATLPT